MPGKSTTFFFFFTGSHNFSDLLLCLLSSPNNKSIKRKEPTLLFVEICFGLVLNFTGRASICFLGLAFSLNSMVLRFIHVIMWNWFICLLNCWTTGRCVDESTVFYLPTLLLVDFWAISRLLLLRTEQFWTFLPGSLGAPAKVSLDFTPGGWGCGDRLGLRFIR